MGDTLWYRRNLPHLRSNGATYFVTWRLQNGQKDLTPSDRDTVVSVLRHFDGDRYELYAFTVMNDHVHVLVRPYECFPLAKLIQAWKGISSRQIVQAGDRPTGLWQSESFDRLIRNDREFLEKATYILANPFKRWPELTAYPRMGPVVTP